MRAQVLAPRFGAPRELPEPFGKLVLVAGVLWLFAPTLTWLAGHLRRADAGLAGPLMGLALALLARQLVAARHHLRAPPRLARAPLALLAGAELGYVACARTVDMHSLSAAWLAVALYAVLGLYTSREVWRGSARGLLLALVVLPLGDHAQLYLGVPARRLSADVVAAVLGHSGVAHVAAETVLVLESGLVYVDAPCSGIRSVWTGAVFFAGATWLVRARLDLRWLAHGALLLLLLVLANIVRVLAIVVLGPVLGLEVIAQLVHEPLGILGFGGACAVVYLSLHATTRARTPSVAPSAAPVGLHAHTQARDGRSTSTLAVPSALITTALALTLYAPAPPPPPAITPRFVLPGEPLPLTEAEASLFARVGGTTALKRGFTWEGRAASLLVVHSTAWRAHHAPEVCLASAGYRVEAPRVWQLGPARAVRIAQIDGGARTAVYWYQSATEATPELSARVWSALSGGAGAWTQVSLLIEGTVGPESRPLTALITTLQADLDRGLVAPASPLAASAHTSASPTPSLGGPS